jgi:hypothetical protein
MYRVQIAKLIVHGAKRKHLVMTIYQKEISPISQYGIYLFFSDIALDAYRASYMA